MRLSTDAGVDPADHLVNVAMGLVMTKAFLLAAVVLAGAAVDAAAQSNAGFCRSQSVRLCDGCVVSRNVVVRAGGTCTFNASSGGALLGHQVMTPPRLGVFGRASAYQTAYRAGPTPGEDYFVYQIRWERLGRVNTTTIQNRVRVIPAGGAPRR